VTQKPSIKRIYHPHTLWEEVTHNMWGKSNNREGDLQWAIEFTGDHTLYGSWMLKVVDDWKYSCEHNLSNPTQNRKAWIGHAACAYAENCPEDIVRKAWSYLDEQQQIAANKKADEAIAAWQKGYIECQNVD
jgi:hypothetical protein